MLELHYGKDIILLMIQASNFSSFQNLKCSPSDNFPYNPPFGVRSLRSVSHARWPSTLKPCEPLTLVMKYTFHVQLLDLPELKGEMKIPKQEVTAINPQP